MRRSATVVAMLMACACWLTPLHATQITYNVDLSGDDQYSGHHMSVDGTLTFDTATNHVILSKLKFHHEGATYGILGVTSSFFGEGSAWHWLATPTELRYIPHANPSAGWGPEWKFRVPILAINGADLFVYEYGVQLSFTYAPENGPGIDSDRFRSPGILTIGEPGFLIGTAVPEPSTLALAALGILGLLIAARRKR